MTEKDILQKMIFRLGQSQADRPPEELKPDFVRIEERTTEDWLLLLKEFAAHVRHYAPDDIAHPNDWAPFFPYDRTTLKQLLERDDGKIDPHMALLIAFLGLYEEPKKIINRLTARHLDYYYSDVLRLVKKPAKADKAHVLVELKKNAPAISIGSYNSLTAGKDKTNVELVYVPTAETVINSSKVDSIRSLFLDSRDRGVVRYAPVANSCDGVGGELDANDPKWHGFGSASLPAAEVGFALASPVLRMKEGAREITATVTVNYPQTLDFAALKKATFQAYITGEKAWLGPYSVSPSVRGKNSLEFSLTMAASEPAIADYSAAVHGYSYTAQAPVLQLLFKAGGGIGYSDFHDVAVQTVSMKVKVSGITSLSLESDSGSLDPKKAFLPFGPEAAKGSRFMIGCAEALAKRLTGLKITMLWKDPPPHFSDLYADYGEGTINNNHFTADVAFEDGEGTGFSRSGVRLFDSSDATREHTIEFPAQAGSTMGKGRTSAMREEEKTVRGLASSRSRWAERAMDREVREKPVLGHIQKTPPEPKAGFITFILEQGFMRDVYRIKYPQNVITYAVTQNEPLTLLKEPYTPVIQMISIAYDAWTGEVAIASPTLASFSDDDVQFFHVAYFGQMREHAYQRTQFGFLTDKRVTLLPAYENEGELLVGFKDLNAGDGVSVLFQVAEGSANPDRTQQSIAWSVLCDNYWKPLGAREVTRDCTNQLLTSGIIAFTIPTDATTTNTILPSNRIWIKGAIEQHVDAVCDLVQISANAIEVQFSDRGNDPSHLQTPLEKGGIFKLREAVSSVKSVKQPFASFAGAPKETDEAFSTRASERLRHKDRCITVWDCERAILQAFPAIHKVKCIPHARQGRWFAPGNVLIVVIPDLKNKNAVNLLEPKADADTISKIESYVQDRAGMQVSVRVKNPYYQRIQLDFKVRFRDGYEFNYYSAELEKAIIRFLSPWAFGDGRDISFGGKLYRSVLLDLVEDLDYVDYVRDFEMYSYTAGVNLRVSKNEVQPATPDAILVSARNHLIREIK